MGYHTFICGTSKSKEKDAYYIHAEGKFWRSLKESGITENQIEPSNYRILGRKYGIYLAEIVDPDKYRIQSDSNIKPSHVEDGMEKLVDLIEEFNPVWIGFVGKNAATWFYRFFEDKEITHSQHPRHKDDRKKLDYGKLDWNYLDKNYYLLTNTHRQWDEEIWMDFWKVIKGGML